jgi:hypothetical protein
MQSLPLTPERKQIIWTIIQYNAQTNNFHTHLPKNYTPNYNTQKKTIMTDTIALLEI